jgi:hypothetical protein
VVNTLGIRIVASLKQRHELGLDALAAVEQCRVDVQRTDFSRLHAIAPNETVHCCERHRKCIFVTARRVPLG